MSAAEIRKYVEIANELHGDLVCVERRLPHLRSRNARGRSAGRVGAEGGTTRFGAWAAAYFRQTHCHKPNRTPHPRQPPDGY
jgi:hypothetical protein